MQARGFTLAGGLGALTDRLIRIGHMGDATTEGVSAALAALAGAARETM
jgi:aspartate aminotransferase-like enzyme